MQRTIYPAVQGADPESSERDGRDTYQYTATKDSLREKNYAQTNTFKFSFFNRIVDMWNWLPFHVRSASSISSL